MVVPNVNTRTHASSRLLPVQLYTRLRAQASIPRLLSPRVDTELRPFHLYIMTGHRNTRTVRPPPKGPRTPEQERREVEIAYLNRYPMIISKPLFRQYRVLFARRSSQFTTNQDRYDHDMARCRALGVINYECANQGLDYHIDVFLIDNHAETPFQHWIATEDTHDQTIISMYEWKIHEEPEHRLKQTFEGRMEAW